MSQLKKDETVREEIFAAIRGALEYANFSDTEAKKQMHKLLNALESELDECDFSPSSISETIAEKLQEYLDELEVGEATEESPKELSLGKDEDEDDDDEEEEIRGLGLPPVDKDE